MRLRAINLVPIVLGTLAVVLFAGQPAAHGQPAAPANPPAKDKDKPAATGNEPSLEDLLAQALKDNPDIRVAEANLHQAEAALNRTRLRVMHDVARFYSTRNAARAKVANADLDLQRGKRLLTTRSISAEELRSLEQTLIAAKADLEIVEAEMPALLGKPPQKAAGERTEQPDAAVERALRFLQQSQTATERSVTALGLLGLAEAYRQQTASQAVPDTVAEKLRKALDTPIRVDFRDALFSKVLEYLQDRTGIVIRNQLARYKDADPKMTLRFEEPLPLRAVLQVLEDEFPATTYIGSIRFVVREYGLLVVSGAQLPPDALTVGQFTRSANTPQLAKNPPAGNVEGTVTRVDDSGLVTISIGSDAGLDKGHTLEVYRLNPAKYLGTVRVLSVMPHEAVARPVNRLPSPVQQGDRVANKIQGN
jgi:hypothetical protein